MTPHGNVEDYDQSIIKKLREKKKWSRRELAEKSGITQQTILNVEQNRFPASLSTITSLIHALGIDFSRYVNISHRYKSAILEEKTISFNSSIDHCLKFYQYNGYLFGHLNVNDSLSDLHLTPLPYFNIFSYVISGCLELEIDGEMYNVGPNDCISYSGLTSRKVSIPEKCNLVVVLKNKCQMHHTHNPLEDLPAIMESYHRHLINEKDTRICKEDMDFSFIKYLRNVKNMSLDTLAEASGLSTSAISLIENNKRAPSLATISAISSVLEETTVNLFTLAQKIPTSLMKAEPFCGQQRTITDHELQFHYLDYQQDMELQSDSSHPFILELHVPVSGEMDVSVEDGNFTIKPGSPLAFDGMRPHSYKPKQGYKGLAVDLPKDKIIVEQP